MPSYKLTYFPIKGRAETARMLFALGDQQYEDYRLPTDKWMEFKKDTMFGGLPMLEVDGKRYCQAIAIERHLARKFGIYPSNEEDQFLMDQAIYCISEMMENGSRCRWSPEAVLNMEKTTVLKEFNDGKGMTYLKNLEKLVNANGVFVGDKVSWPDIAYYNSYEYISTIEGINYDDSTTPKLKALRKKVETHPRIAAWLAKRPQTPF